MDGDDLGRWEAINLFDGRYCGIREVQRHGFPYKQFGFIPPAERHSAMVSYQRAIKVLAATLRMNLRGGIHEQTR
jgi:hypothetical protein